ncbi:MAG: Tol-Pal system beta propeller repeat protein TolB [Betaproteobacteria bacterium]|nr:Tol-Pal system beta propeller repeat protein TolB [Betaproteobacteria bacterium]
MNKPFAWLIMLAGLLVLASSGRAQIQIQIESEGLRRVPIAIAEFPGEGDGDLRLSQVIVDDLRRSGRFRSELGSPDPSYAIGGTPFHSSALRHNLEYVLVGRVDAGEDKIKISFQLFDALTGKNFETYSISVEEGQQRLAAHVVSNWLSEQILGIEGAFTSKIAYVLKSGPKSDALYELKVADYDGHNPQTVVKSTEPLISPEWSPDGNSLYYVSFEQQRPIIYEFNLLRGEPRVVAAFSGNNSAPAVSPDGRWLAAALSEAGSTNIFLISMDGTRRLRMRESSAINTEPDFAPDGRAIAYVSDELGSPHIYIWNQDDGSETRLTYNSYNVSPAYSPDGSVLAYVRRDEKGFNIHAMETGGEGRSIPLTSIRRADSPSFSPDGSMVLFKDEDYTNRLFTVSVAGKILFALPRSEQGEIINPLWGPIRSSWY